MAMLVREDKQTYQPELLDLRNDFVFKSFFGNKRNINLLHHFLNAVLGDKITSVQLRDPNLEKTHKTDKTSIMDVRVDTDKGEQINVEIQLQNHKAFNERMLMYWTKMYGSQDHSGQDYTELNRAVQILITDFVMFPKKRYHRKFRLIDDVDYVIFTDHIEVHVLQLPEVRDEEDVKGRSELEQWLLFLKGNQKTKEELAMESTTMKEAFEEIERLSQDPETRRLADYWSHELGGRMQLIRDAKEEGLEQGLEQGKRDIVISMYRKKLSAEDIASFTDLSLEKVKEIIAILH